MLYAVLLNFFGEIAFCVLEITDKILSTIGSNSLFSHVRTATSLANPYKLSINDSILLRFQKFPAKLLSIFAKFLYKQLT